MDADGSRPIRQRFRPLEPVNIAFRGMPAFVDIRFFILYPCSHVRLSMFFMGAFVFSVRRRIRSI